MASKKPTKPVSLDEALAHAEAVRDKWLGDFVSHAEEIIAKQLNAAVNKAMYDAVGITFGWNDAIIRPYWPDGRHGVPPLYTVIREAAEKTAQQLRETLAEDFRLSDTEMNKLKIAARRMYLEAYNSALQSLAEQKAIADAAATLNKLLDPQRVGEAEDIEEQVAAAVNRDW